MNTERVLWTGAGLVALVATAGSLTLSGIGPLGWRGLGMLPCELCWYQRILMYPLPVVIGVALWRRLTGLHALVLPLSGAGLLVASYHVLLQARPRLEANACYVGSCTGGDALFGGLVTVPQLSFTAFLLVSALGVAAWRFTRA